MYNTINITHEFDHQYQSYDNHTTIIFLKYHDDTTLSRFLSSKAGMANSNAFAGHFVNTL